MANRFKYKLMDIHTHILPGVDDGAVDIDEALRMIALADKEGISVIILTPHYGQRNPGYDPDEAVKKATALRKVINKSYPHMKLYMGNELYYSPGIIEDLKTGRAKTIGGTDYALVEFSVDVEYEKIITAVRNFTSQGYHPLLAHVERYRCLYKDIERVHELIEMGAYIQVNARGFLSGRFDKRGAWCKHMLQEGVIHFIASDCHDTLRRTPVMKSAVEEMIRQVGEAEVKRIVNTNIVKLIRNEFI